MTHCVGKYDGKNNTLEKFKHKKSEAGFNSSLVNAQALRAFRKQHHWQSHLCPQLIALKLVIAISIFANLYKPQITLQS